MATLSLRDEQRVIREPAEISAFLERYGLWYRRLDAPPRCAEAAQESEILAAYAEPIRALEAEAGYRKADVVRITPDLPDLDALLARFEREHVHDEDEIRLLVDGRGLFHVHPEQGPVFAIEVEAGDMLRLPRGIRHWFHVCAERRCRAVRLFQDVSGWTPRYTESGLERRYPPVWQGRGPHAE